MKQQSAISAVSAEQLPDRAMIRRYLAQADYADCLTAHLPGNHSIEQFVDGLLNAPLFRLERWILAVFLRKPSQDSDVSTLLCGDRKAFAAWTIESRDDRQLLLRDFLGHTRSWFMVGPENSDGAQRSTRVHYGTAIACDGIGKGARRGWRIAMPILLPLHLLYARLLFRSALRRTANRPLQRPD